MPIRLTELRFSGSDDPIATSARLIVLVGANNVGKTQALENIESALRGDDRVPDGFCVRSASFDWLVDADQFLAWVRACRSVEQDDGGRPFVVTRGSRTLETDFAAARRGQKLYSTLEHLIAHYRLRDRLALVDVTISDGIQITDPIYRHPPQRLVDDAQLLELVDSYVYRAFRVHVVADGISPRPEIRLSERAVNLGDIERIRSGRPAREALGDYLGSSRPIVGGNRDQGHGVQAFLSILLRAATAEYPIALIDEPEAFLHPPQAREMGRLLADSRLFAGQAVIATHSADLVEGLIDQAQSDVQVLRLTRTPQSVIPHELSVEALERLRADPLLRQARVLDGLFHSGVVITEGPSDAQFLQSLYTGAVTRDGRTNWPDLMFLSAGGKSELGRLAAPLVDIGVQVRVVADLDLANDMPTLRRVVEGLGGSCRSGGEIERDRSHLDQAIRVQGDDLTADDVRVEVDRVLCDSGDPLTRDDFARLRAILRFRNGWSLAKKTGLGLVAGQAHEAGGRLLEALAQEGIFLLPGGELESFDRSIGSHGSRWVAEAWSRGLHEATGEASIFLAKVARSFSLRSAHL